MQGILLAELQQYIDDKWSDATWHALLEEAGLTGKVYSAEGTYPDEDLVAIVRAVPAITPVPLSALAEDFGAHVAPALLRRYGELLQPEWRTLDVLSNVESIYLATSASLFGEAAAVLRGARDPGGAVTLTYASHRRLCALLRGIARGVGAHFGEALRIDERACMHRGAKACEILIDKP